MKNSKLIGELLLPSFFRNKSSLKDRVVPGSNGEHRLQKIHGTEGRAKTFYNKQVLDHLSLPMVEFVKCGEILFIATSDASGECDCSLRSGPKGFVKVINDKRVLFPEYRGNGVMASMGNISENPHIGMIFVDFIENSIGLHINGRARIRETEELIQEKEVPSSLLIEEKGKKGRSPLLWIDVEVKEAYIHCSKHIPRYSKIPKKMQWGSDDPSHKGGDFFEVKDLPRPWNNE